MSTESAPPAAQGPTPRTDARSVTIPAGTFGIGNQVRQQAVHADFARQLERELNAMSAESQRNREAGQMWAAKHAALLARVAELQTALAPLAKVADIADLYRKPPCSNPNDIPDGRSVLFYEHGKDSVDVTLGDCRAARALLNQRRAT